jgi:hypothetical protein
MKHLRWFNVNVYLHKSNLSYKSNLSNLSFGLLWIVLLCLIWTLKIVMYMYENMCTVSIKTGNLNIKLNLFQIHFQTIQMMKVIVVF